jgi:hypothetical protein
MELITLKTRYGDVLGKIKIPDNLDKACESLKLIKGNASVGERMFLRAAEEIYIDDIPGSLEGRLKAVRGALREKFPSDSENQYWINVHATFPGQVLFEVENEQKGGSKTYMADYMVEGGQVSIDDPKEVKISLAIGSVAEELFEKLGGIEKVNQNAISGDVNSTRLLMAYKYLKSESS